MKPSLTPFAVSCLLALVSVGLTPGAAFAGPAPAAASAVPPTPALSSAAPVTRPLGLAPPPPETLPAPGGQQPLLTPEQRANELGDELKAGAQNQSIKQGRLRLPQYLYQANGALNPQIKVKPDAFAAAPPVWQALNAWRRRH